MYKILLITVLISASITSSAAQSKIDYGNNADAGKYITINGVKLYYEKYGHGKPLLLIHGNMTPTRGWAPQIAYFSNKYTVYSVDCRGRGKSELGKDSLSYIQQANDLNLLIKELKLDSVYIIGKSDGAIIAILMGIYYPQHIQKIVAFSANMQPDTTALFPALVNEIHFERVKADSMLAVKDTTKNWLVEQQRYRMMEYQPHITADHLHKINIPVLVMSGDRDLIREEHTLFIYKNIRFANLCILPNQKHGLPKLSPLLFNTTIENYFETDFKNQGYRFDK